MIRVTDRAEADEARLDGVVSIGGPLRVRSGEVRGVIDVFGKLEATESFRVNGTARFHAPASASRFYPNGRTEVMGGLDSPATAEGRGILVVRGPWRCGALRFDGTLQVEGSVIATSVDVTLHGKSSVETLQAGKVLIRQRRRFARREQATLRVSRMEATEVFLEGVSAEHLRADRVTLGPDCHIAHLTGMVVSRHRTAHVGPEAIAPRPYGLTP